MTKPQSTKRIVLASLAVLLLGSGFTLAGCAADSAGPPEPSVEETQPSCDVHPIGCGPFESRSGTDPSGNVAWLGSAPLTVSFAVENDTTTLVVVTPCNTLNVPVQIGPSVITPDASKIAIGTMGCAQQASSYEAWTVRLISQPITYQSDGQNLILENSAGTVVLAPMSR